MHKALKIGCLGLLCVAAMLMLIGFLVGGLVSIRVSSSESLPPEPTPTRHIAQAGPSTDRMQDWREDNNRHTTFQIDELTGNASEGRVAVFSVLGLIAAMILAGFLALLAVLVYLLLRSGGSRKQSDADEAKTIQEMYTGLQEMEKRIESLETILLDAGHMKETDHDHAK